MGNKLEVMQTMNMDFVSNLYKQNRVQKRIPFKFNQQKKMLDALS